jgi:hypothetical protein
MGWNKCAESIKLCSAISDLFSLIVFFFFCASIAEQSGIHISVGRGLRTPTTKWKDLKKIKHRIHLPEISLVLGGPRSAPSEQRKYQTRDKVDRAEKKKVRGGEGHPLADLIMEGFLAGQDSNLNSVLLRLVSPSFEYMVSNQWNVTLTHCIF